MQHPMTATVLNNLGEALARQKRIDEAEPLIRKALKVSTFVL
jgi:Tfp pilus assembly protein PilF